MHSTLRPLILAGILALAFARAAASPLVGHWAGAVNGRRAVTLKIRDEPLAMLHLKWDGDALHFDVAAGDRTLSFELSSGGNGKATLKRVATENMPALSIELSALR